MKWKMCPACKGTGKTEGNGIDPDDWEWVTCQYCHGRGEVPDEK